MADITHGFLADNWMHFRQMAALQSIWSKAAYRGKLQHFAKRGAQVILIFEGCRLVASTVYFPIKAAAVLGNVQGVTKAMARTCIFVAPDCKARGIGARLHRVTCAAAVAGGYSHLVDYSFASQEVQDWSATLPGMTVAAAVDPDGAPVHIFDTPALKAAAVGGNQIPRAALAKLRRLFTYRADGRFDHWRLVRPILSGRLEGDCEDFALTLAFYIAGRSWPRFWWHQITGKSVIWYCKTSKGVGHAVLWHRGAGWADNIFPAWQDRTPHRRLIPFVPPLIALKLLAGLVFSTMRKL